METLNPETRLEFQSLGLLEGFRISGFRVVEL